MQRVGTTQMRLIGDFSPVSELLAALLARDPATRAHLEHVNYIASRFANLLGLSETDTNALLLASVLHDVGKIAIPDKILRKPGRLTEAEYRLARKHPELGETLIAHHSGFELAAIAVRHHHERYDGTGYPDGLRGEGIPYLARIVSLIDVYSAMTVDRPYHKSRSTEDAVAELRRFAGTQFDAVLVEQFADLVEHGGIR
jgi:HD-GYP domain-containing protein (c-di-GMP phosphodiesterase class II)